MIKTIRLYLYYKHKYQKQVPKTCKQCPEVPLCIINPNERCPVWK
jgi:hypothetical protein